MTQNGSLRTVFTMLVIWLRFVYVSSLEGLSFLAVWWPCERLQPPKHECTGTILDQAGRWFLFFFPDTTTAGIRVCVCCCLKLIVIKVGCLTQLAHSDGLYRWLSMRSIKPGIANAIFQWKNCPNLDSMMITIWDDDNTYMSLFVVYLCVSGFASFLGTMNVMSVIPLSSKQRQRIELNKKCWCNLAIRFLSSLLSSLFDWYKKWSNGCHDCWEQ